MRPYKHLFILSFVFLLSTIRLNAQDRFNQIEQTLKDLSQSTVPGLNEKVDLSVSGVSVQEFLRGLAESNNLNINIDQSLNFKIYNNFTNEKVLNIILFLVKEFDLNINFIGSIMSFTKYTPPPPPPPAPVVIVPPPVREIIVKYNTFTNQIMLDLKSDTLEKVVKKITQVTKKNVILSSGISNKLITVYILDMPFENAIQKMAYTNNLKVIKTEDDFYIIKPMEEGEDLVSLTNAPTDKAKSPFNKKPVKSNAKTSDLYLDVEQDSLGDKRISIEAINVPILEVIKKVTEAANVNYMLISDIKGNTTTRLINILFDEFLRRLLTGTEYTYKVEHGIYLIGERRMEVLRANSMFQFKFRSFDEVQEVIPAELKKGVEIKEFKNLNSILLTGSLPQILEIEAILRKLDRVVPMVLIEVIIVDIRKGKSISTGIKAGLSDTIQSAGKLFPGIDFTFSSKSINDFLSKLGANNAVNIGRVTPDFYISLSALELNNNVEVRSTPKLSTLNGHEANLAIGSKRYYVNETQNVVGSLNPQTVITRQFHEVNANLAISIVPVVAGDDEVTLNIDVSNSDFLEAPSTNAPPASTLSHFKSIIRVRNEEMIVLGGLERTEKSEKGEGVPILSRIPVLKWIFSSRTKSKSKAVTLVFIKPTIIY